MKNISSKAKLVLMLKKDCLYSTAVEDTKGPSTVLSSSSACKESNKLNINLEDIGCGIVGDTDPSPVAQVERTKQDTKLCNLPKLPTGIISRSPVFGEKSRSQKR